MMSEKISDNIKTSYLRCYKKSFICILLVSVTIICYFAYGQTFKDSWIFETDKLAKKPVVTSERTHVEPLSPSAVLYHTKVFSLLDVPPPQYIPNLKSPCWLHEDDTPRNDQEKTQQKRRKRKTRKLLSKVSNKGSKHDTKRTTRMSISLKCLPHSFIAGFPKCGTTDLYTRLRKHPNIVGTCNKEPTYFNHVPDIYRPRRVPFGKYIDCYKELSEKYTMWYHSNKTAPSPNIISKYSNALSFCDDILYIDDLCTNAVDGSTCTIWRPLGGGYSHRDHRYIIHHLMPRAKFVVIMRDPVTRTYSDYNFRFKLARVHHQTSTRIYTRSPESFHAIVKVFIKQYTTCRTTHSQQECIERADRNPTFNGTVWAFCPIVDFYAYHIKHWLDVFPREQFLFLKYEDYKKDMLSALQKVMQFLGIDHTSTVLQQVVGNQRTVYNRGAKEVLPMYNATRTLLQNFYRPYNKEHADLLHDERFMWS